MSLTELVTELLIPVLVLAFAVANLARGWVAPRAGVGERWVRVQRQQHRRQQLIDTWRSQLLPALREGISRDEFLRLPAYATLRPHLSGEFKRRFETGESTINVSDGPLLLLLTDEIARIERKWKGI